MKSTVFLSAVLCTFFCSLSAYAVDTTEQVGTATTEEANLSAITQNPAAPLLLFIGEGAPFSSNRDLFDQALFATRQALKINPRNTSVRANLGALYLWRDNFHPEESGGYAKAMDQFLVTLRDDPVNSIVLTYLGTHEVFSRITSLLPPETAVAVETSLKRSLEKYPRNPAAMRTLVRLLIFLGRPADALPLAHTLAKVEPEQFSSQLLLGILELKKGTNERARVAFDAALILASNNTEKATVKLGLSQLLLGMRQLEAASATFNDSTHLIPRDRLEYFAHVEGLASPDELSWALGKALAKRGDIAMAIDYVAMKDLNWLSSMQALEKNNEGAKLYKEKNLTDARRAFIEAMKFIPLEPIYWRNLATTSYELGRYRESIWAYGKVKSLEPLRSIEVNDLAISFAVLGDYQTARELLEQGVRDFPNEDGLKSWLVVMAYGAGGWQDALDSWSSLFGRQAEPTNTDLYKMFVLCRNGLYDIMHHAEEFGMHYQSLGHESLLYRELGESLNQGLLSDEGRNVVIKERETVFNKIINNYQFVPLKPVLLADAQAYVLQAKALLDSNDWPAAIERYKQASEAAPWWPDGHYILALLASKHSNSVLEKYSTYNNDFGWYKYAIQEMNAYLALIPSGSEKEKASKLKEGWQVKDSSVLPGKDEK